MPQSNKVDGIHGIRLMTLKEQGKIQSQALSKNQLKKELHLEIASRFKRRLSSEER